MATDQVRTKAGRNEAFVASQLARAEQRIRRYDVAAGWLCVLTVTLLWFVGSAILHRIVGLPSWVRVLGLAGYAGAAGFTLYTAVVRPWRRPLNPLYTAFLVERLLPEAHNSVANYLNLRQQHLPGTLRQALGLRAARDLTDAEPERAVSARPVITMGSVAGGAVVAVLASIVILGMGPFLAVIWPFSSAAAVPVFRLAVVSPDGGNATIPAGRTLTITALAENVKEGHGTDLPRLLFRYQPDAPEIERPLRAADYGEKWSVTLPASDVRAGFTYRVSGYGAETPTYRIAVRANPALVAFRAVYHPRAYVGRTDRASSERNLEALCGTEVTLRIRADRPVKTAFVDLQRPHGGRQTLTAQKVPDDPQAFEVKWTIDQSGSYSIRFISEANEAFAETTASTVTAIPDKAPTVELTEPATDEISLPADGILRVAGKVRDDIGVAGVKLRLRLAKGAMLPDRPMRTETLALAGGGYVQRVDFLDVVDMARLRIAVGPSVIGPNAELEGWLEARDGCDFPSPGDGAVPHIVESRHFRIRLQSSSPAGAQQREKEQKKAQADKERHDRDQEDQRRREEQDRDKQNQQAEGGATGTGTQTNPGSQDDPQQRDNATSSQADKLNNQRGQGKPDGNKEPNEQSSTSEGKGDAQQGKSKEGPDGKQGQQPPDQHGDAKDQGGPNGQQAGAGKEQGKPSTDGQPGSGKEEGGTPGKNPPGEGKPQGPGQADDPKGESKPDANGPPDAARVKGGSPAGPGQAAEGKPGPDKGPEAAESKPAGTPGDAPPAQARGAGDPGSRGTARDDGGAPPGSEGATKPGPDAQAVKAEARPAPGPDTRDPAQAKPERPQADVTLDGVKQLEQDLQDTNPRKQVDAVHGLKDAAANAKDPQAREEARDALEREGLLPPNNNPAHGKPHDPPGTNPGAEQDAQAKPQGDGPATPGSQPSEGKGGAAPDQTASKDKDGTGQRGRAKDGAVDKTDNAQRYDPRSPQKARAQRATVLQLLSAKDVLTRDKLQKAGIKDEAAYRQFLADCEALLRRPHPAGTVGREDVPGAQLGAGLPSLTGRPSEGGTGSDLGNGDQGKPPPGYQRAYDELTRKLNQMR